MMRVIFEYFAPYSGITIVEVSRFKKIVINTGDNGCPDFIYKAKFLVCFNKYTFCRIIFKLAASYFCQTFAKGTSVTKAKGYF